MLAPEKGAVWSKFTKNKEMDIAAQRLRHALSPALWGFPAVASNERSPTDVH